MAIKYKKWWVAAAITAIIGIGFALKIRVHLGYYADNKAAAESAMQVVFQRYNKKQFDAIYDSFVDDAKKAIPRAQAVSQSTQLKRA